MSALETMPKKRPGFATANLMRAGQGEIVVRQAGRAIERRRFNLLHCDCGGLMDHGDRQCASCQERR